MNNCLSQMVGFTANIVVTIIIYTDAKKLRAGAGFQKQEFFKATTWHPSSWAILVFFFGIIMLIVYFICRKDVFMRNNVYIGQTLI